MTLYHKLAPVVINQTKQVAKSCVIFLHGSGDTAANFVAWLESTLGKPLSFPSDKLIFPSAPARPYTPAGGQPSNVWFDRLQISPVVPEDEKSVQEMTSILESLVRAQIESGIPPQRIVIGGFSMGGAMALHLVAKKFPDVAGVFTLSGFLSPESSVFGAFQRASSPLPKLFYAHGDCDPLVPIAWGEQTYQRLTDAGLRGVFHALPGVYHELQRSELLLLRQWISKTLPE